MHRTIIRFARNFSESKQIKLQGLKQVPEKQISNPYLSKEEVDNFNHELQQNYNQYFQSKALNFSKMEDGKIVALESFLPKYPSEPIHNKFIDLAAFGFTYYNLEFASFSYASMGALALYAVFLSSRVKKYAHFMICPKIVRIKKLEDGNLEIDFNRDGSETVSSTEVVSRDQFKYGVSAPEDSSSVKSLGIWCKVKDEYGLICGNTIVNNHVFHEII